MPTADSSLAPSTITASSTLAAAADETRARRNASSRSTATASEYVDIARSTMTTARATMPISLQSPMIVKFIAASPGFLFGLELEFDEGAEGERFPVLGRRPIAPGLHRRHHVVVERRFGSLLQGHGADAAGDRHADLGHRDVGRTGPRQVRRKVGRGAGNLELRPHL